MDTISYPSLWILFHFTDKKKTSLYTVSSYNLSLSLSCFVYFDYSYMFHRRTAHSLVSQFKQFIQH